MYLSLLIGFELNGDGSVVMFRRKQQQHRLKYPYWSKQQQKKKMRWKTMDVHNRRVGRDLPLDSSAFRWSLLVCEPATSFCRRDVSMEFLSGLHREQSERESSPAFVNSRPEFGF
ncbi:hypothetical protein ACFX2I_005612 [Malus domestica]